MHASLAPLTCSYARLTGFVNLILCMLYCFINLSYARRLTGFVNLILWMLDWLQDMMIVCLSTSAYLLGIANVASENNNSVNYVYRSGPVFNMG